MAGRSVLHSDQSCLLFWDANSTQIRLPIFQSLLLPIATKNPMLPFSSHCCVLLRSSVMALAIIWRDLFRFLNKCKKQIWPKLSLKRIKIRDVSRRRERNNLICFIVTLFREGLVHATT